MKHKLILLSLLCICSEVIAQNQQMTPFLNAQTLKENLNSKDSTRLASAISYVGGIADYLLKIGGICPPEGATVATAASVVKADLNLDSYQYRHLSAVIPVEYALKMKWHCD